MCYNKYLKNIIVFVLVISVIFVSIGKPVEVYAAAAVGSIGATYGVTAAKAILAFVLASSAVGVTYDTYEEARKAFTVIQGGQGEDPDPEEKPPGTNWTWKELLFGGITGLALLDKLDNFIDSFKDTFGEVQEGENQYTEGNINEYYVDGIIVYFRIDEYSTKSFLNLVVKGGSQLGISSINLPPSEGTFKNLSLSNLSFNKSNKLLTFTYYFEKYIDGVTYPSTKTTSWNVDNYTIYEPPLPSQVINYYITNNAPLLDPVTNPPDNNIMVPYLPDYDSDNEKLKEIITPQGKKQLIYEGTQEQYLDDVVNNVTWEDIQSGTQRGTNAELTPDGDLLLEPGTIVTPYPDINIDPITDSAQFQGQNIGLLQSIINWLSNIYNAILSIPQSIGSLFIPEVNPIQTNITNINNSVNERVGNPAAGYVNLFDPIEPLEIPDLYYKDNVIMSAGFINGSAETIRNWQRYLWTVVLILLGLNNVYKLIRGTDLITIKGQHGKGWSSNGN